MLIESGEPVGVVSQRLGHSSPVVTMSLYWQAMDNAKRQTADKAAALLL